MKLSFEDTKARALKHGQPYALLTALKKEVKKEAKGVDEVKKKC